MGKYAGISAISDLDPGFCRTRQTGSHHRGDHFCFVEYFFRIALFSKFLGNICTHIHGGDIVRSFLFHQLQGFCIQYASVFYGINPGHHGKFDALCAMRMSSYFLSPHMCFINERFHFFQRILRGANTFFFAQHTGCCTKLNHISSPFNVVAHPFSYFSNTISHTGEIRVSFPGNIGVEAGQI